MAALAKNDTHTSIQATPSGACSICRKSADLFKPLKEQESNSTDKTTATHNLKFITSKQQNYCRNRQTGVAPQYPIR